MTRQEEIQTLQSLKGDTYFAQKFGVDIDKMCENINNDFGIELGCKFMEKETYLKKSIEEQKEKLLTFAHNMILNINNYDEDSAYKTIEEYIGKDEVIKYKYSQDIELNRDDINYLVNKLK